MNKSQIKRINNKVNNDLLLREYAHEFIQEEKLIKGQPIYCRVENMI